MLLGSNTRTGLQIMEGSFQRAPLTPIPSDGLLLLILPGVCLPFAVPLEMERLNGLASRYRYLTLKPFQACVPPILSADMFPDDAVAPIRGGQGGGSYPAATPEGRSRSLLHHTVRV